VLIFIISLGDFSVLLDSLCHMGSDGYVILWCDLNIVMIRRSSY